MNARTALYMIWKLNKVSLRIVLFSLKQITNTDWLPTCTYCREVGRGRVRCMCALPCYQANIWRDLSLSDQSTLQIWDCRDKIGRDMSCKSFERKTRYKCNQSIKRYQRTSLLFKIYGVVKTLLVYLLVAYRNFPGSSLLNFTPLSFCQNLFLIFFSLSPGTVYDVSVF